MRHAAAAATGPLLLGRPACRSSQKVGDRGWCGLQEHPNIIRCYRCWQDTDSHCINLITEYFTSGNLREYRQKHRHLDTKAVKKWARQVKGPVSDGKISRLLTYPRTHASMGVAASPDVGLDWQHGDMQCLDAVPIYMQPCTQTSAMFADRPADRSVLHCCRYCWVSATCTARRRQSSTVTCAVTRFTSTATRARSRSGIWASPRCCRGGLSRACCRTTARPTSTPARSVVITLYS